MVFKKKVKTEQDMTEEELRVEIERLKAMKQENVEREVKGEEPKKPEHIWEVGEVPTETARVIVNTKTNEQQDVLLALAGVKNDLEEIKKALLQ